MNEPPVESFDEILVIADSLAQIAGPVRVVPPFWSAMTPFVVPFDRLVDAMSDQIERYLGLDASDPAVNRSLVFGVYLGQVMSSVRWQDQIAALRTLR